MGTMIDGEAGTATASPAQAERSVRGPRFRISAGLFGVVLPGVCLILDPVVFAAGSPPFLGGGPLLGPDPMFPHGQAAAWVFVGIEAVGLLLYAFRASRAPAWHAFFAGLFLIGALVAFALGVVLLPLSLVGVLLMGLGLLGLVPFATGLVFLGSAARALRSSHVWRSRLRAMVLLLGMAFATGVPAVTWVVGRWAMAGAIARLETQAPRAVANATGSLRRTRWIVRMDDLVIAWNEASDPAVRDSMAQVFEGVTGRSIEERSEERGDGRFELDD